MCSILPSTSTRSRAMAKFLRVLACKSTARVSRHVIEIDQKQKIIIELFSPLGSILIFNACSNSRMPCLYNEIAVSRLARREK